MTTKHRKHTKLARPKLDQYSRLDISWLGAPCSIVNEWMSNISKQTKGANLLLVDADHHTKIKGSKTQENECITHDPNYVLKEYDSKIKGLAYDAAFINGNHYQGSRQVVFLHPEKRKSVEKRMGQITQPLCYISIDNQEKFDFLPLKGKDGNQIPTFNIQQEREILELIQREIDSTIPPLTGLILSGGKSSRMGEDKASLKVGKESQQTRLEKLLLANDLEVSISKSKSDDSTNTIADTFLNMGPLGAICSAFQKNPNAAYLVVACDLMLLNSETIELLIQNRNPAKMATCFQGESKDFPDPLLTIYEPKSYKRLLEFLALGYSCPRKMLINSDCEVIPLEDATPLTNVNTPKEYHDAIQQLGKI